MIVATHVTGQRGALIDPDLGGTSRMREYNIGIECSDAAVRVRDCSGGHVRTPPVVCSRDYAIDVLEVGVSGRSGVPRQPAELHRESDAASRISRGNSTSASRCGVSGNCDLGK